MAEQILSREHFYIGTTMPLDRLLTFFYTHPGFHMNNVLSMFSIQLFVTGIFLISVLAQAMPLCDATTMAKTTNPVTDLTMLNALENGCFAVAFVYGWIRQSVIAILFVLLMSYLPLLAQLLSEHGFVRAMIRLGKHMLSLTPLFEVFSTQIYAFALMTVGFGQGGSAYISTGRGFATSHIPFHSLFSLFSESSIHFGLRLMFLLVPAFFAAGMPSAIWFFWLVALTLCISPFLFNPHQFSAKELIFDYQKFLNWLFYSDVEDLTGGMAMGDDACFHSWIRAYHRKRTRLTGIRHLLSTSSSSTTFTENPLRSHKLVVMLHELLIPFLTTVILFSAEVSILTSPHWQKHFAPLSIFYLLLISMLPLMANFVVLAAVLPVTFLTGGVSSLAGGEQRWNCRVARFIVFLAKVVAIASYPAAFLTLWLSCSGIVLHFILMTVCAVSLHRLVLRAIVIFCIPPEIDPISAHRCWVTGRWQINSFQWHFIYTPITFVFFSYLTASPSVKA